MFAFHFTIVFNTIKFHFGLQSNYSGLTRQIEFDTKGVRSNVEIDIMSLGVTGLDKIGTFKPVNNELLYKYADPSMATNLNQRLTFFPPKDEVLGSDEDRPINEMTFNVIVSEVMP